MLAWLPEQSGCSYVLVQHGRDQPEKPPRRPRGIALPRLGVFSPGRPARGDHGPGKVLVGVSDTTPPLSFRKAVDGSLASYDLDLVRTVAKRMGVALGMAALASAERIRPHKERLLYAAVVVTFGHPLAYYYLSALMFRFAVQ